MKKVNKKVLTKDLSQSEIVTLAVFLLGGDATAVDTEDAAVKTHELAPSRFSWRKYPEQINLELVRVYLSDAKKPGKGALLVGSGRTGWQLTQAGLKWAREAVARFDQLDLKREREESRSGSIDEVRWRRERGRILSSSAWKRWEDKDPNLTDRDAREIFRIDSYADGALLETKITRLLSLFHADAPMTEFLTTMAALLRNANGSHE